MVLVTLPEGVIEGETVHNEYGGTYCSFKGIPYAEPPVGELRFQAPKPPKKWSGIRNAKKFGPPCYQHYTVTNSVLGEEDCLYLNVYSPNVKQAGQFPVMFWIYGGGYVWGSGNDDLYGPQFLVKHDVILVTFNYRVGALGFLCLDTKEIPGNAGMKDQVAALRWVNKNIDRFGGDPNNVTIFGESVGASSVTYHINSPMSKGLFKRAIVQSGTNLCPWATPFQPRERALALARKLGCKSENDEDIANFFKSAPLESLIYINVPLTFYEKTKNYCRLQFGVVKEKKFGDTERFMFGDNLDNLRNMAYDVDVMIGYVEHEGLLVLAMLENLQATVDVANDLLEFFIPNNLLLNTSPSNRLDIGKKIKKYYFQHEAVTVQNLCNYFNFEMFVQGVMFWVKEFAKTKHKNLFLYKLTCKTERNFSCEFLGITHLLQDHNVVCHFDDVPYLFNVETLQTNISAKSLKMIERITKLWTNFAKFGNPTPDGCLGVKWKPYTLEEQDYLEIGEALSPGEAPDDDHIKFWEEIFNTNEHK